ncbi:MAG TPA: helix-turn-helix domain-containing protein [Urbifossiella sp.]|jgi:hypothetical protein|nr:helix-turn-helix domain-containing protein [Urbifossiella sp.]
MIRLLSRIDRKLARLPRTPEPPPGSFLTISKAAEVAGVSTTTIRRAIRLTDGPDRLPALDQSLGRGRATWRIDPVALDAWRRRREGRPPTPAPQSVRTSRGKAGQFRF